METLAAVSLFVVGAALAIWATDLLVEGLAGLALLLGISSFAVAALFSGLEAENVAVGLAAGHRGDGAIALGSIYGGGVFLVCVAVGLGALLFPLRVQLPRSFLLVAAAGPLLAGLPLAGAALSRAAGALLLVAFVGAMIYLVSASRRQALLGSAEVEEAEEERRGAWPVLGMAALGIGLVSVAGALVAEGAGRLVRQVGVPALLMGMVVTPATIEIEEVFRQAVPARRGRPEISAGNALGTLLYFTLFNEGLLALLTPVEVPVLVRTLDWPFLVGASWLALAFLWRGRLGRLEGAVLLAGYALFVGLHVLIE